MRKNELQAILETLSKSVKSGLNATLTPADCRLLLAFIRSPPAKRGTVNRLLQKMTETLTEVAEDAIDDLKRR